MAITFCSTCYPLSGVACGSSLDLTAGLSPLTVYYVWVKDRFDKRYVQEVTTDGSGDLTLDLTAFPDGLFASYTGSFIITVSTSETEDTEEEVTIGTVDYTCYIVDFKDAEVLV